MTDNDTLLEEHRRLLNVDMSTSNLSQKNITETHNVSSVKRSIAEAAPAIIPAKKASKKNAEISISGQLLSTASHDIRTSLTGIVGMTQLISDTELNREQRNCIDAIQQSSSSLLKTINYVLDISRLESGKMALNESSVDLQALCKRVTRTLRPLADLKSLSLSCACDDGVPLSIMCDENLMERLVTNLLQNSINKTDQGSVSLNIKCHGKSQKGADFIFCISDTRSKNHAALPINENLEGMDRAIVDYLIEIMGGEFQVAEKDGAGYTAFVRMTLQQANRPAPMKIASVDQVKKIIKSDLKILFAEDNKLNQKVVEKMLSNAGCKVDTAENGTIALEKIRTASYDLVIMDCQMPIMDGYEATAVIRNMDEPVCLIPIIAVTANAMGKDREKCLASGMNAYLTKPIERQELIDLINKYTDD